MTGRILLGGLGLLLLFPAPSHADRIRFAHASNINPRLQNWAYQGAGIGTGVGPVDDGGVLAWFVNDTSMAFGSGTGYFALLNPDDVATATHEGWRIRVRMRTVDVPDDPAGSPHLYVSDGTRTYTLHFGTQADGDPTVRLLNSNSEGSEVALEGAGPGYHLYELTFEVGQAAARFSIDGTVLATDYPGYPRGDTPQVHWGANSSADTGRGNFALVEFYLGRRGAVTTAPTSWGRLKARHRGPAPD